MKQVLIGGKLFDVIKLRAANPTRIDGHNLILKLTAHGWKITCSISSQSYRWTREEAWANEPVRNQDHQHFTFGELETAIRKAALCGPKW